MKKKIKIILEVDAEYTNIKKVSKRLLKDFNNWIKYDTELAKEKGITPILYMKHSSGAVEYSFISQVKMSTYVDEKKILSKSWKEKL